MTTLRLRLLGILLIILSTALTRYSPRTRASSPGSVIDTSEQVIPGATVTLVNEAPATPARLSPMTRRVHLPRGATGHLHGGRRTGRLSKVRAPHNVLNASGQLAIGALKLEIGTVSEVVTVTSQGTVVETKNSDYSGLLTSTQIQQIQTKGRDVVNLLRLLPGVHYENDIDALGDSFGSNIPNMRAAPHVEPGDGRRPQRQRAVGNRQDELVDQPRRDRRSESPAEHLQGGVRTHRRREY